MQSEPRKAALAFIFVTVALDMFAMGVIAPVLPRLVTRFVGGNAVEAAQTVGVFATVWALMQFFCSPIVGSLSDRFGRRPVILISNIGLGLDYVLMALAPSLSWLFAGRIISGITAASVPAAMAYIADVTPPEKRASSFGIMGGAFGLGFILGPSLGGLLGDLDPRLPFWISAVLSLLNGFYGVFVLPESLAPLHRQTFSWRRANPLGALNLLRSHSSLLALSTVLFLDLVAHQVFNSVYVLYVDNRYAWSARTVGLSLAAVGVCSGVVNVLLVKHVVARVGDRTCMLIGITLGTFGLAALGLAPTGSFLWSAIPLITLWGLAGPTTQSLLSQHVSVQQQGQLQGATNSLSGIAGIFGPALFANIYAFAMKPAPHAAGIQHDPGLPFYVAALTLLGSLVLALLAAARAKNLPHPVTAQVPSA